MASRLTIAFAIAVVAGVGIWAWRSAPVERDGDPDTSGTFARDSEESSAELGADALSGRASREVVTPKQGAAVQLAQKSAPVAVVSGVVRDANGSGIRGATVVTLVRASGKKGGTPSLTTQTADDGSYSIRVAPRVTRIRAVAKGHVVQSKPVSPRKEASSSIDFRLRAAFAVTGRVADEQGRAVAGASVGNWDRQVAPAKTDEDGRFFLDHLDPEREHWLQARARRFVPTWKQVEAPKTGPRTASVEHDFVLRRGARVHGVVVAAGGQRVAGAELRIRGKPPLVTKSDAKGEFELEGVRAGEVRLIARHADFAPTVETLSVPGAGQVLRLTVELRPGAHIRGLVVDEQGKPVANATVAAWREWESAGKAVADAAGRFELRGLAAGQFSIRCDAKGFATAELEDVAAPRSGLRITLARGARIAGTVVDGVTGQPVTDFRVRLLVAGRQGGKPDMRRLKQLDRQVGALLWRGRRFRSEQGHWDTGDGALPDGFTADVEVRAEGYAPLTRAGVRATRGMQHDALRLELTSGVALTGRVVAATDARPIAGAAVRIAAATSGGRKGVRWSARARSEQDGSFSLSGLAAGKHRIVVEHEAWGSSAHEVEIPAAVRSFETTLRLEEPATLVGVVRDAAGAPQPEVGVSLQSLDVAGMRRRTTSDARGRFEFTGLPRGVYRLARVRRVGPKPLDDLPRTVRITSRRHEVELSPRGLATVRLQITAAGGAAPAGVYLNIEPVRREQDAEAPRRGQRWFFARGSVARIEGFAIGRFRIRCNHTDKDSNVSWSGSTEFEVSGPAEKRVELRLEAR